MTVITENQTSSTQKSPSAYRGVRVSKYRHVFGRPARREACYENLRVTTSAHDSHNCAVNPKFIAVAIEVAGGGAYQVLPLKWRGKIDYHFGRVGGHNGPVTDLKWNPFNDNVIASASDDGTVKIWHIADDGVKELHPKWLIELCGHTRRVSQVEWHPTAENVLASAGFDCRLLIWNASTGDILQAMRHNDVIYDLSFSRDGSHLATTCKDRHLRIYEPRGGDLLESTTCHEGVKSIRVCYLGDTGLVLTTGFSRASRRQVAVWRCNHLAAGPVITLEIDASAGTLFPYFDPDLNIVYLAGKGEGSIRYYELSLDYPHLHYLTQYCSRQPQRGLSLLPKRALDVAQCEIARFYKVHSTQALVEPISFIVPRKTDVFHSDIYPPTAGPTPALTCEEWLCGLDRKPVLVTMRPSTYNNMTTHKGVTVKNDIVQHKQIVLTTDRNTDRKFAFLSQCAAPDYRPIEEREDRDAIELEEKAMQRLRDKHRQESVEASDASSPMSPLTVGTDPTASPVKLRANFDDFPSMTMMSRMSTGNLIDRQKSAGKVVRPAGAGEDRSTDSAPQSPPHQNSSAPASIRLDCTHTEHTGEHSPIKMQRLDESPENQEMLALAADDDVFAPDVQAPDGQAPTASTEDSEAESASDTSNSSSELDDDDTTRATSLVSHYTTTVSHKPAGLDSPQHRAFIASRSTTVDVIPTKVLPGKVMPVTIEAVRSNQFVRTEKPSTATRPGRIGPGPIVPTKKVAPFRVVSKSTCKSGDASPAPSSPAPGGRPTSSEVKSLEAEHTDENHRLRELLDSVDAKDALLAQLRADLLSTQRQLERANGDARRWQEDVASYQYEIQWKNERIAFLEEQLVKLDPSGVHIDVKTRRHKKTSKHIDEPVNSAN